MKRENKKNLRFVSLIKRKKILLPNRSGFELAISTLVVIVLGILILLALVIGFTTGWRNFWDTIRGYSGSDIDNALKLCESQCNLGNKFSYCCEEKNLGKEKITCLDKRLKLVCEFSCEGVCGGGEAGES